MSAGNTIITVTLNPAVDKVLVVPGFEVGAHARAESRSFLAAGKGINVARGIARMGGHVGVCALIGQAHERMFAESLAADNIVSRFCLVRGHVRTNTTILDPIARTTTHVREPGFEVTAEDLAHICTELADWMSELPPRPTLVFAGSVPPSVSPESFVKVLQAVAEGGGRIVLDTNGAPLKDAVDSGVVHTVKPNLEELAECLQRPVGCGEAVQAAKELLGRVNTVLLTLGQKGAWLIRRDALAGRRCPLAVSEIRNTVGCGDAFLAGWLVAEQWSADPARALCWAVATGAASATSDTSVGYTRGDADALLPRCQELPLG